MTLKAKRIVIALLGAAFLVSLLFVQWMEVLRKQEEVGRRHVTWPADSYECISCHAEHLQSPGIVEHWEGSTHAEKGVGCLQCHRAEEGDIDAFKHYDAIIATVVTPKDCAECHPVEAEQFMNSYHAKAGNILHSQDNFLAETVEGSKIPFAPFSAPEGAEIVPVNGMAAAFTGCQQCHGSKVGLQKQGGGMITVDDLRVGDDAGKLTEADKAFLKELTGEAKEKVDELTEEEKKTIEEKKLELAKSQIVTNEDGKPLYNPGTWPNTGIGRLNLDGSRGSCSACHSRHDFSPRRARQPENCGKCHLGPDHPQKEIYEESKHGIAYRDLKDQMNLDAETWVLGQDYSAAPTCATCHLSANLRNKKKVSHDPGQRIAWTNRPKVSVKKENAEKRRENMKDVCLHCHTQDYVNGFFRQYDDFVVLYNEKFGKPALKIMNLLKPPDAPGLLTKQDFDEEIEWTYFYLWHHEGRRARHGASMMAPDYAHWHGTYEVAERFYTEFIPQAREIIEHAPPEKAAEAEAVGKLIEEILARPEHAWFEKETKPQEQPAQP